MLFGQCPNGGGDKLKGASLNMVRWIVWIGNELQREEDIENVFLFLSEKIAVPCGEILAMTLFWVFGAFFYQDLSHL